MYPVSRIGGPGWATRGEGRSPRSWWTTRTTSCGTSGSRGDRTREWQRLEELLEGTLIKLSSVVWSLAAAKTAHKILEAIAGGQISPQALAALAHGNVKAAAPPSGGPWRACAPKRTTSC